MLPDRRYPGTPFQRRLGIRWLPVTEPGSLTVAMDIDHELRGPAGSLEGGVVSTLVDVAGASACAYALGSHLVATEHISLSLLAPGRIGPVEATGRVLRAGRHDAVAEVHVVDRGKDDRLMAVALVTVRNFGEKPPAGLAEGATGTS